MQNAIFNPDGPLTEAIAISVIMYELGIVSKYYVSKLLSNIVKNVMPEVDNLKIKIMFPVLGLIAQS
jgi:hypothetical protein